MGDGAALLRRRPDLRQAERRLAADTARIGVAVADLYPRVTLGASGSYLRNDTLTGDRAWSFALGPLVSWSFPNIAAARSRIEQAEAQSAASLARFDGAVLNALKETEQALSAYDASASAMRWSRPARAPTMPSAWRSNATAQVRSAIWMCWWRKRAWSRRCRRRLP